MIGIYFSGTGNTKYCVEKFLQEYDADAQAFSIEDEDAARKIKDHWEIVMGYPVQYSNIPKILTSFIADHQDLWRGKKIFVIATMGLFSGDGAGILGRLLESYGASIQGGLHLKMPDSICDEKVLKRPLERNRELVAQANVRIEKAVQELKSGNPPQEGLRFHNRLAGLFGQRLYFCQKTKNYSDRLKIDPARCTGCGKCAALCPMKNIRLEAGKAVSNSLCTMCYRCVSRCPARAITLLGKKVIEQCRLEKYL